MAHGTEIGMAELRDEEMTWHYRGTLPLPPVFAGLIDVTARVG
jgi:hypothetical protein